MGKVSILLVEDSFNAAIEVQAQLANMGYETFQRAASGEAAVELLSDQKCAPDLILMDIHLGNGIDGIETTKRLQQLAGNQMPPVVFLTSLIDDETFDRAAATYPEDFLQKPVQESKLKKSIKLALQNAVRRVESRVATSPTAGKTPAFVQLDGKIHRILPDEILWLKGMQHGYCEIQTKDNSYLATKSGARILQWLENMQMANHFFEIKRGVQINVNQVTEIEGNTILFGKHEIIGTKSKVSEFKEKFNTL